MPSFGVSNESPTPCLGVEKGKRGSSGGKRDDNKRVRVREREREHSSAHSVLFHRPSLHSTLRVSAGTSVVTVLHKHDVPMKYLCDSPMAKHISVVQWI